MLRNLVGAGDHEVADDLVFFFSSRRRHTRFDCDWSSDVCSSDLAFPERKRRTGETSCLDPYTPMLPQQWEAGCRNATHLWRTLRAQGFPGSYAVRSEERRVGKECRSRWSPNH